MQFRESAENKKKGRTKVLNSARKRETDKVRMQKTEITRKEKRERERHKVKEKGYKTKPHREREIKAGESTAEVKEREHTDRTGRKKIKRMENKEIWLHTHTNTDRES